MKKKIVALCLVVAMAAVVVIGGTMAYFTDTDKADNTFTVGNVKIDLIEQERGKNENGEKTLVDFNNGHVLMPIVGSAQDGSEVVDGVTLPTAANYVDKIISVKNTGASDAYMRVFVAIPVVLDNVGDAAQNILHFNWNEDSEEEGQWTDEKCVAENVTVEGVQCNIYSRIYKTALTKGQTTATPAYVGFYLDKNVDNRYDQDGKLIYTITRKNVTTDINFDFTKGVTIPVFAQGIQAAGFADAEDAFAKSGLPTNPWAK